MAAADNRGTGRPYGPIGHGPRTSSTAARVTWQHTARDKVTWSGTCPVWNVPRSPAHSGAASAEDIPGTSS